MIISMILCLVPYPIFHIVKNNCTSSYATWFTAGGAIHIAHYDVIDDVITQKLKQIEKNGDNLAT